MAELDERLGRAERPLVVVGGEGWTAEAGRALVDWAAAQGVPVAADFRAWDAVPHDSAAYVGALGYGRADALAALVEDADLIVHIGAPRTDVLSDGYRLAQQTETVVIMTGEPLGHSGRLDQLVEADPRGLARALPDPRHGFDPARLQAAREAQLRFSTPVASAEEGEYVDLTAVMAVLREELTEDAVVTFGAGNHAIWPARYLPHHVPGTLLAPRNGAMGMGIPAAVAAALVDREREVVSVAGDGCFLMNGQEIATAVGTGARFVAIVVDNGVYATIREHQEHQYPGRPSGTQLTNPDFAAFARAFGGFGATVTNADGFREAYRAARASGLPAVLHLRQDPSVRAPRTDA
ncbi:thiamine pyrophosphate-dependent enzyme [Agrococcus sp. ARC_14]|uniref:thiamine pyrophosphate-dependent enzyme n=1 Tax=Agrococcus sp. ARC_14 TaxID=2919927 RepID=UPI001F069AC9|nr:thiamine pyrophosphate-dependent enzyme [Agrococcus sp. ARC_14]MCH1881799.1 thiamine pyrophosphate-dependent enzyme [Agrococcus sp. ARC_14]